MSPSAAPSMPINICLSISHESNGFVCQMEAKDGMAFFLNFLFFHQFFLCKVFGKRVGGFRKICESHLKCQGRSSSICYREILGLSKEESFSNQNKDTTY